MEESPKIKAIIPHYGEARSWVRWCKTSIETATKLDPVEHPYDGAAVLAKLRPRPNAGNSAYAKAHFTREYAGIAVVEDEGKIYENAILVVDADTLFLEPFDWQPENQDTVIAMAPGGDPRYLNYLIQLGLIEMPEDIRTTLNCGVIWLRTDVSKLWDLYYPLLADLIEDVHFSIGEVVWNAFWHHFRREGKAEIMPQKYNQLYGQQGIEGAAILHFAGIHPRYKGELQAKMFKFFFEQTDQKGVWRRKNVA